MIANCPTQDKLKSLSIGQLPEEQSDVLLRHLENCESCQDEISQLDQAEDTFVRQIKTAGEATTSRKNNEFETEDGCRIAVTRALAALATAEGGNQSTLPNVPDSIGEYDIVKPLGAGGMGHVYLGRHTKLSRPVAIKFIADHRRWDQTMHERFESEMRLIGGLKHPNIVVAHDAREVDGLAVLVTEYIDGMTVSEILKRTGRLETADACKIVGEVCKALSCIDSKGLVHRDIKPSNIMIDDDGSVKLLDLGLARLQAGSEMTGETEFTATGQAMGTADYVAPEQVNDSRNVDIRADIYGLGCTFYKLLAGQAPFAGKHQTAFAKMNAHVSEVPESLGNKDLSKGLPNELISLVDKMLEKNPDSRPKSPSDVLAKVEKHSQSANLCNLVASARTMPDLKPTKATTTTESSTTSKPKTEGSFFTKYPWVSAIAGGLAAFAFGMWLGIIITVKKPDGTTSQVEIPNGSKAIVDEQGNIQILLAGSDRLLSIPKEQVENRLKNRQKQIAGNIPIGNWTTSEAERLAELNRQMFARAKPLGDAGRIYINQDSAVFGKIEKGDSVDVVVVETNPKDDRSLPEILYNNREVLSLEPLGEGFVLDLGTESKIPNSLEAEGKKVTVEFHDPERQLRLDEVRLNGVWRSVLTRRDGKIIEEKRTLLIHRSQFIPISESQLTSKLFRLRHQLNGNFMIIKGIGLPYRFSASGKLEIDQDYDPEMVPGEPNPNPDFKSMTRFERVTTPVSNEEKAAFETIAFTGKVESKFECYLAEDYDPQTLVPDHAKVFRFNDKELLLLGKPVITNKDVARANVNNGQHGPELKIELTREGSTRMGLATVANVKKKMAIVVNGKVVMAPVINSAIYRSLAVIGDFERKQLTQLAKQIVPKIKFPPGFEAGSYRTQSLENLRRIMLAFHNYESAFGHFPGKSFAKVKGGHPYSWRIEILPFLERKDLYDQYDFNEPWDSKANQKVLNQMPDVFRHPSFSKDSTITNYVSIFGKNATLGTEANKGNGYGQFTDGLSNTVCLIESKAKIPWTKPEDFLIDSLLKDGMPDFDSLSRFQFLDEAGLGCAFGDGNSRFFDRKKLIPKNKADLDKNGSILIKLFSINDGTWPDMNSSWPDIDSLALEN